MSSSATFINLRVNNAEQFKESVSEPTPNTKLYLTFGKVTGWANDADPDTANSSIATEHEVWYNMIGGKRILANDLSHVIPRYNWSANTKYTAYDHMNPNLYDGNIKFYILTGDYNVYKCISNNYSSNSTVEPTSINPGSLTSTSDGYIWKYMYTISDSDRLRFTTSQYIPVRVVTINDGSLQYQVQDSTIFGEINDIVVTDGGEGYTNTSNIVITINGDGTSAAAIATIDSVTNTVNTIVMIDYGYDYTYATVQISGGGGTGAAARAMISPIRGHGTNALYELGGNSVMVNGLLKNSEEDFFPISNDYRQVAILKDPLELSSGNIAANLKFLQAYTISTIGTGDYQQDEIVYQGPTLQSSSFNGKIVSWDSTNGVAVIINTLGTPTSQSLFGSNTSTSRFVSSVKQPDLNHYTGQVLYVDNVEPISRALDQTEDFKIVIKF